MSHAQNDDNQSLDDEGQKQQDEQQASTADAGSKKKRIVRVVKTAPPKPAPKKSIATVPNSKNDDDDGDGQQDGGNESNTNQTSGEGKAKKPKVVVVVKRKATKPELSEFEQAAAAIAAAAPSAASIITANAIAAVEAREKEPKLQCSECQQQLPKSDFSSSQAKKMVGRKCKQCVVKVAELEARMAEESAQYEAKMALERELQRIRQAMSELENSSEPAERQKIVLAADSELASLSHDFASVFRATERDLHELRLCAIAFFLVISQDDVEARHHEPQGRWIFSCATDLKKYKDYHKSRAAIPRSFIPDEMWCTRASSARLLANPARTLQALIGMWTDVEAIPVASQYCKDAGQLGMYFPMLHRTANVIHDLYVDGAGKNLPKELSGFDLARLILSVDKEGLKLARDPRNARVHWVQLHIPRGHKKTPGIGDSLAKVTLAVLRDMPPDATATEEQVVGFMTTLVDCGIGLAPRPGDGVFDKLDTLFRFLFVSDDVNSSNGNDARNAQHQPAANQRPCFIARVLGRSDNSLPDSVGQLMFVFLVQMVVAAYMFPECIGYLRLVADVVAQPRFIEHVITVGRLHSAFIPELQQAIDVSEYTFGLCRQLPMLEVAVSRKCGDMFRDEVNPSVFTDNFMSFVIRSCFFFAVRDSLPDGGADQINKQLTRVVVNVIFNMNQIGGSENSNNNSRSAAETFVNDLFNQIASRRESWKTVEKAVFMRAGRAGGLSDEQLEALLKPEPPV